MHWLHDRENNTPIGLPCTCTVYFCSFFQCHRNIFEITGIQKKIHWHIEYHIKHDHTNPVSDSHLRSLFYKRHHQDREWNKHTAHDIKIRKFIKFAVCHVSSDRISGNRMNQNGKYHCHNCDQQRVSKRIPEICDFHCFCKIRKAPGGRQGKCSCNIICHLGRLFECNDHCHI